ncbi:hypothetical protein GCM10011494_12330 [Novosphingobium endophyticum]|uniref:Uncharacterized protein n=1 Tax=Novosphingobium endophyticum TaxID=1955250 RepID=A0A916TQU0_9SPHN|nr:hypothetical protein GCM10011494_12330 [Novosphingobium endophyticum]
MPDKGSPAWGNKNEGKFDCGWDREQGPAKQTPDARAPARARHRGGRVPAGRAGAIRPFHAAAPDP